MRKKKRKRKTVRQGMIAKALVDGPINYFSDLFIVSMVISWIIVLIVMTIMAIYSTVMLSDNSIWSNVESLTAIPLTAGGAIWMVKNSVQHAIMNSAGKECKADFPKVNADGEDEEHEARFYKQNTEEAEG